MSSHEGTTYTPMLERSRVMLAAAVLVLVAVGVFAGVAGGGRRAPSPGPPAHALRAAGLRAVAPDLRLRRSLAAREDRAIGRTMRYTPYVSAGGRRPKEVALTFDDGPGPYTRRIVRELRRLHARATFFEVGEMMASYPGPAPLVRRWFPIGEHTLSHPQMALLPPARQRAQILEQAARMRLLGGRFPRLFRPPYASFDPATLRILRRMGMLMVLWSVDSEDYTLPGTQQIVHNVLSRVRPGAIVLMHDAGGPRDETAAALPIIVRRLRRRGYRLVTVPRMLLDAPPPHRQKLPPGAGPG